MVNSVYKERRNGSGMVNKRSVDASSQKPNQIERGQRDDITEKLTHGVSAKSVKVGFQIPKMDVSNFDDDV